MRVWRKPVPAVAELGPQGWLVRNGRREGLVVDGVVRSSKIKKLSTSFAFGKQTKLGVIGVETRLLATLSGSIMV